LPTAAELAGLCDARGWTAAAPVEHVVNGVAESRWIAPAHLREAVGAARDAGCFFESMTCTDRLDPHGAFELLYTFNSFDAPQRLALRVWSPKDAAVPSVADLFDIAAWNEREAWELYGIAFDGNPNLTWLLLPEGTEFRPLLKSFTTPPPSVYDGRMNPDGTPAETAAATDEPASDHAGH
jgi:NADH-quinone oxidoreductase subunit C